MAELKIEESKPVQQNSFAEKNINGNIKSIILSGDRFILEDGDFLLSPEFPKDELPGVYLQGIQYYDLQNIGFLNNTNIALLVELLKSLLEKGVEVRFVNVSKKIKSKIKSIGLDHILICETQKNGTAVLL